MEIPSAKKRGFAFLPVLIILASVLIGTGSVLLLREKINEEQGASFKGQEASFDEQETSFEEQGTRDEGQVARDKEQETSFDEQGGSDEEQVARDKEQGGSGEQISNFNESNNSEQVNKNTNNNEISSTSVVEGEKIESKIQDLPSKIYLEADNDGKDELNLGRTLKIKGGEGIKTSLSNNTITITNTGNTSPNSTVTVTESTDYDFDVNQFEVSDNAVSIKDIFVKRTDSILIPGSNISTLTNDSGYITDGNTNWDNSYGYITASSSDALTNKSGNISQWTNDSGYITGSSSSALTNKTGNISMWTNDSGYITDGNTGWDNSYGFITDGNTNWDNSYGFITDGNTGWDNSYNFITASSSDALTNKTGNISMWTNDANFITLTSLSSSATGLTYTNTTGVFSLSSGYVIPTTTQETNWGTAYTNRVDTWNYPLSISSNAVSLGYNTTNLKITSNQLNTIQDIATTSSPTFTNATLSNNLAVAGKVGIGSTDPQKKLEINDNDADTTTSGVRFGNFVCTSSDKLTVDANGDIICATDQTGSGTGNIVDTLSDTLAAGNNANSLNITNIGRLYTAIGLVGTPSFSFQSDQDTGMYSSGTDTLNFTTGGSERMRIGSTGNVGVGTTNPSSKLHVAGNTLTEGNILPEMTGATGFVSTRTIGDTNNRFSDIWTEEMHIGASSLYVNGKKVISDVSDVMNFTTDTDQSMIIKSVGSGNLTMQTDTGTLFLTGNNISSTTTGQFSVTGKGGINLTVPSDLSSKNLNLDNNSLNGNITLTATGLNSQILANAVSKISLTSPALDLLGHVSVGTTDAVKNLTVSGTINTATISGGTLTSSAVNGVTTANILTTGSSFSGDVSGTYNNLAVSDDSHAHTTTTISGLDISSDTNLSGDTEIVLTGDALSIAGSITRDTEWNTVAKIETATSANIVTSGENISLLANDSAYITDGNTGWDNSYNFITASSSDALTNKTGNISMWTNDANFITLTSLSSSATGLTYTNTTGAFSLTSGYVIPTTTQETNWGTAYTNRVDTWNYPLSISSNAVSLGYNTTNLKITTNQLNTIQDIASTSTPTFGGMTLNGTLTLGTYSLTTSNNTVVANFNADLLDGQEGSYYAAASSISGTTNYLAKFSGTGAVGNSIVFDNGTNVGIGTTSPLAKLNVQSGTINDVGLLIKGYTGQTADLLQIKDSSDVQRLTFNAAGNLGIGTTAPSTKLHVSGTADVLINPTHTQDIITIQDSSANMLFDAELTGYRYRAYAAQSAVNSFGIAQDGGYQLLRYTNTNSSLALMDGGGNVGIGTTNPGAKLEVSGFGDSTGIRVGNNFSVGRNDPLILDWSYDADPRGILIQTYQPTITFRDTSADWAGDNFRILTNSGVLSIQADTDNDLTFETTPLSILSSGNVGIGTTAPAQKLHVEGHCITGESLLSVIPADRVKRILDGGSQGKILDDRSWILEAPKGRILDDRSWILEEQKQDQVRDQMLKDLKNRSLITKKQIKDVVPGDYVYSLDEKTGQTTPNRINKLLDMGVQPVFELTTESGKKIQTTGNHPYFSILNNQTNGAVQIRGIEGLAKRSGLSPDDLSADKEFSQTRTLWTNRSDQKSLNLSSSQLSGGTGETTQERINSVLLQQSGQSLRNSNGSQDSSEAGLSQGGTNQNNYQQNSRNTQTTKRSDSLLEKAEWTKVIDLIEGDYIATVKDLRSNNKDQVVWEKISNIKYVGKKQVYDIEVKDTHNFIANEIFAHNTYISGNVGIGTTAPGSILHVKKTGTSSGFDRGLWIEQTGISDGTIGSGITIQNYDVYSGGIYGSRESGWANGLTFYTHNASAGNTFDTTFTEKMRITSSGNVGIGTTAPWSKLSTSGEISTTDKYHLSSAPGNQNALTFGNADGAGLSGANIDITTWWGFGIRGMAGNPYGDGTRTIVFDGRNGNLTMRGQGYKPGGGSWADSSDSRLKKDIAPVSNAISKIMQLNPVQYKWINPEEHGNQTGVQGGFIAQEIQSIFPGWVSQIDPQGKDKNLVDGKSLALQLPFEFNALLVQGMKEQQASLNSLDLRVTDLEDQLTMETGDWKLDVMEDQIAELNSEWVINNGEDEIEQLKTRVAELENFQFSISNFQTISNDSNSNDNTSVANENLNSNDNVAIDPAVALPEADKSVSNANENLNGNENSNSNDNLNIDQQINDQLSVLGIGNIGDTVLGFFKEVWFSVGATFEKTVAFLGEVTFIGVAKFEKPVELGSDSVGQATVLAGTNNTVVTFGNSYEEPPVITLTLANNADLTKYYVSEVTTTSFKINIEPNQTADTLFNWHAFGKTKKTEEESEIGQ